MQLTAQQIERLQNEKPAISAEEPSIQATMNASQGSQWLALVTNRGQLQVRRFLSAMHIDDDLKLTDP